jgi:hypothetical protein
LRNRHLLFAVSGLFAASSVLLASSFTLTPALAVSLSIGVLLFAVASGPAGALLLRPVEWRWLGACLLIATLISVVGGQGHFVFAKDDWLYRDAVLADIVKGWLPVVYADGDQSWLLRAPLGMYLLPGALGHVFGLYAAHLAQLAQNSLIFGAILYLMTLVWPTRRLLFVALFILFSGVDAIPVLLRTGGSHLFVNLAYWSEYWDYPPNLGQYVWSPNHALPGWWFATLAVLYLKKETDLATLAAISVPLALWSPLMLVGAAALFAFFVLRAPGDMADRRFAVVCAGAAAFLPVLTYLGTDSGSVPRKWLIFEPDFTELYLFFIPFALPQVFFLLFLRRRVEPWLRSTLYVVIALLLILPVYQFGPGVMNDFSTRVQIVPRTLLAFGFNALVIELLVSGSRAIVAAALLVVVEAVSPTLDVSHALVTPAFGVSECNLVTIHEKLHPKSDLSSYFARLRFVPEWIRGTADRAPPLSNENRICWPERAYGEKLFNWLKPENRIWLRRPTPEELSDRRPQP